MLFAIVILGALVTLLLYILFRITRKTEFKSTSIVSRIEKVPELSTAKLTITQIYEMEKRSFVPGLSGKYTLIVPITVRGFLDLSTLKEENIEVLETSDAKRVTLRLPLPNLEITVTLSQLNEIKVINESGMLVKMFGPKDKLRILKENTNAIREKAIKESEKTGIIDIAKESARNFFHGLLLGMGFDEVIIYFQEDVPLENKVSPLKIEEK
ncbi:DUF4230 domain-containing protein [Kosmotoga olearia]|uniref:DUF4230 domain-containing protein n=1 Tax=Kosmotoga olearia (strain ATCC BAA-1733 / DSM 21960 / TBF 19.5.1) TaxID=521045 RepID=C5CE62_KOSOT|nr:DUF4230 domain-containing protein [Kosmotoga olearia]ACR79170.1 hypothetical protein Kole_0447 [Kosmotoga olearia TBF 19.5.1]